MAFIPPISQAVLSVITLVIGGWMIRERRKKWAAGQKLLDLGRTSRRAALILCPALLLAILCLAPVEVSSSADAIGITLIVILSGMSFLWGIGTVQIYETGIWLESEFCPWSQVICFSGPTDTGELNLIVRPHPWVRHRPDNSTPELFREQGLIRLQVRFASEHRDLVEDYVVRGVCGQLAENTETV